jgi:hypothetical protein
MSNTHVEISFRDLPNRFQLRLKAVQLLLHRVDILQAKTRADIFRESTATFSNTANSSKNACDVGKGAIRRVGLDASRVFIISASLFSMPNEEYALVACAIGKNRTVPPGLRMNCPHKAESPLNLLCTLIRLA